MVDFWTPKIQLWLAGNLVAGWTNVTTPIADNLTNGVAKIDSLIINGGRSDVTVQPSPMQAQVDIVTTNQIADSNSAIGSELKVLVYNDYTSAWDPLFTGVVTDKILSLQNWSDGNGLFNYSFIGVSRLASLSYHRQTWSLSTTNAVTHSGFTCSQRIVAVLSNWQYSPTWVGSINSDTIYIHKRAAGTYIDAELITSAAQTGRGCFHDRADGKVYYNNYANTLPSSAQYINESHIIGNGVTVVRSLTSIVNAIHITTTDASSNDATSFSSTSQSSYGYRYGSRDTECDVSTDMDNQATDFLAARKNPRWRPQAFTIDLGLVETTELQYLPMYLPVRTNTRWVIPLPSQMGGDLDCLVDNWAWRFSRGRLELDLQMSLVSETHP
jgi:hypothetical protein